MGWRSNKTKFNSSSASKAVLFSETDGHPSNDIVYLRYSDTNTILRLNLSLEPRKKFQQKLIETLKGVFLPEGYPESVSQDYAAYQLWDTLQACASTITGTLSTKVILESVGVGKGEASAISAAITWNVKQSSGMIAGIVFAWMVSCGLDMNCKKWRLFADIINDLAMCIELLVLPFFFQHTLPILCISTALKALVGVAGGATRAAITQHQAINQNTGDVSAKDGSQETCVNLFSSFIGLGLISLVTDLRLNWCIFFALTILHLYANYRAVKCLNFTFFNESRLALAFEEYIMKGRVPSPAETNKRESVFLFGPRKSKYLSSHKILIGRPLDALISPEVMVTFKLQFLTHLYKDRNFMILLNQKRKETMIALSKNHSQLDLVEAYFHGVCQRLAHEMMRNDTFPMKEGKEIIIKGSIIDKIRTASRSETHADSKQEMDFSLIMEVDSLASSHAQKFISEAIKRGWDLDKTQLPDGKWRANWRDVDS